MKQRNSPKAVKVCLKIKDLRMNGEILSYVIHIWILYFSRKEFESQKSNLNLEIYY